MTQSLADILVPSSLDKANKGIRRTLGDDLEDPSDPQLGVDELEVTCKNGQTVWTETI
jgi:hypothetical protein